MVVASYSRTYEDSRGMVYIQVTNSDLLGASVTVLVRYGDYRPDRTYGKGGLTNYEESCKLADSYFQTECKGL